MLTSRAGMAGAVSRWLGSVKGLPEIAQRLMRVQIENAPAEEVIQRYDTESTVFYLDPPYVHSSRGDRSAYAFEMSDQDRERLASARRSIRGRAVLSGYRTALYDELYAKWRRVDAEAKTCHSVRTARQESLWLNFARWTTNGSGSGCGSVGQRRWKPTPTPMRVRSRTSSTRSARAFGSRSSRGLLGKIAEPSRHLPRLQKTKDTATAVEARWNPRSFCTSVVVPWNRDNESVLGGGDDPYVSKPLRRPRLDEDLADVKKGDRPTWESLVEHLGELERSGDPDAVREAFIGVLGQVVVRLKRSRFHYPVPNRVSVDHLCDLLDRFMKTASGGLRPQVVGTALMRVVGEALGAYSRVEAQGVNESDRATGAPGDIMCFQAKGDAEELRLVAEAKSGPVRLVEAQASVAKARASEAPRLVFFAPGVLKADETPVQELAAREFAFGLEVYVTEIGPFARALFMLLEGRSRRDFLTAIGRELDERVALPEDPKEWSRLLEGIGSS